MSHEHARARTDEDLRTVEQADFHRFRDQVTRFVRMPNHLIVNTKMALKSLGRQSSVSYS